MATTATPAPAVFTVVRTGNAVTLTSVNQGGKSLTYNAASVRRAGASVPDLDLMGRINDAAVSPNKRIALTRDDMMRLISFRDKTSAATPVPAPVVPAPVVPAPVVPAPVVPAPVVPAPVVTPAPVAAPAPVPVAPAPVPTTKPVPTVTERVTNRTEENAVHRMMDRAPTERYDETSRVTRAQAGVAALYKGKLWSLEYDIPDDKLSEVPNPSNWLWRYGFRRQWSCWVLPEQSLEAEDVKAFLADCEAHGITVDLLEWADSQMGKLRAIAHRCLEKEIIRLHTSFILKLDSASAKLKEANDKLEEKRLAGDPVSARDYDRAEEIRYNKIRGAIKNAVQGLENALVCARLFEEHERVDDLIRGVRDVVRAEQQAFNALMEQQGRKVSDVYV